MTNTRLTFSTLLIFSLSITTVGCGSNFDSGGASDASSTLGTGDGIEIIPGDGTVDDLGVCGPLHFESVSWPKELTFAGKRSFALALNVTGSFEGHQLWSTIADNSDGQGLSLGLLQQNLGQGTLQPLMIRIRDENPEALAMFSTADRASLLQMLSAWEGTISPTSTSETEPLFSDRTVLSSLDIGARSNDFHPLLTTSNAASVEWAKAHLYSNGKFIARWKSELIELANTAAFRSLQVEKAQTYFTKSEGYFTAFRFQELRSFLLMYDFVVQNGGFTAAHKASYEAFLKANPSATETQKAKKLLDIRLASVSSTYRADVKARKTTVIDSIGTVHGSKRNLPLENCYEPNEILATLANLSLTSSDL